MRVLQLSDLHVDVNSSILKITRENFEGQIINYLKNRKDEFDILFIVGDISNNMMTNIKFLDKIEAELDKKVLFVPGNHDIYINKFFNISSKTNYDFYKNSKYNLFDNPYKLTEDFYVIGGLGWYDYSFYTDTLKGTEKKKDIKNYISEVKQLVWADGKLVDFKETDIGIFNKELKVYKKNLDKLQEENKKVWFVNHFIPYSEFVIRKKDDDIWNATNAFMGSRHLGDLLDTYENVKYVSFGHTHTRFGIVERNGKTILCKPLGYVGEWGTSDFKNEMDKISIIIEL